MELNKLKAENLWIRIALVILILLYLGTMSIVNRKMGEITKLDSTSFYKLKYDTLLIENNILQSKNDSIYSELFIQQTINGRNELALDFLKRVNPKGEQQYQNYIKTLE